MAFYFTIIIVLWRLVEGFERMVEIPAIHYKTVLLVFKTFHKQKESRELRNRINGTTITVFYGRSLYLDGT